MVAKNVLSKSRKLILKGLKRLRVGAQTPRHSILKVQFEKEVRGSRSFEANLQSITRGRKSCFFVVDDEDLFAGAVISANAGRLPAVLGREPFRVKVVFKDIPLPCFGTACISGEIPPIAHLRTQARSPRKSRKRKGSVFA